MPAASGYREEHEKKNARRPHWPPPSLESDRAMKRVRHDELSGSSHVNSKSQIAAAPTNVANPRATSARENAHASATATNRQEPMRTRRSHSAGTDCMRDRIEAMMSLDRQEPTKIAIAAPCNSAMAKNAGPPPEVIVSSCRSRRKKANSSNKYIVPAAINVPRHVGSVDGMRARARISRAMDPMPNQRKPSGGAAPA